MRRMLTMLLPNTFPMEISVACCMAEVTETASSGAADDERRNTATLRDAGRAVHEQVGSLHKKRKADDNEQYPNVEHTPSPDFSNM